MPNDPASSDSDKGGAEDADESPAEAVAAADQGHPKSKDGETREIHTNRNNPHQGEQGKSLTTEATAAASQDVEAAREAAKSEEEPHGGDGTAGQEEKVEAGSTAGGGDKLWMYLDGFNPTQHGPFPQSIMLKLLRTGSAHKDMMAWAEGMAEWQALGQVS